MKPNMPEAASIARVQQAPHRARRPAFERAARSALDMADDLFARIGSRLPAQGALIPVLFHSLYRDKSQLADKTLAPNQDVTVEDFRRFIDAMLESGCTAVSPAQVDAGLPPDGKYVMITFDDGYYNNTLALDVLHEFRVPAAFFISSDHVLQNKGFWWDAFSREMARSGACERTQRIEIDRIKTWTSQRVEGFLRDTFGIDVMKPRGELDRPFTAPELRDFARSPWVHIGNHTCDHAILTNCSRAEIARELRDCQKAIAGILGQAPIAVAYPNGNYSPAVIDECLAAGLRMGFTTRPHRNRLPLHGDGSRMTLGRFLFMGGKDALAQARRFNSGFIPSDALRMLLNPVRR
jgi:peptidoglycan/xylan/chitin deacetylase (PgdA/CDA1 family)